MSVAHLEILLAPMRFIADTSQGASISSGSCRELFAAQLSAMPNKPQRSHQGNHCR